MTTSPDVPASPQTEASTLHSIVRMTSAAVLCTLLISWRLYAPGFRLLAPAPALSFLTEAPAWLNWSVLTLCAGSLLRLLWKPNDYIAMALALSCAAFWVLQDINRFMPYTYMYGFALFIALFSRNNMQAALGALRVMVSGVYFWAGFHKLNLTFYTAIMPWFIAPLHTFTHGTPPDASDTVFVAVMFLVPFFEALIGILLWFPRWRKLATVMAFIMLLTVLACLGPWGHNWAAVVWPWNVYLFLLELSLFMRPGTGGMLLPRATGWQVALSAFLFALMPGTAMFIPAYAQPGFKLYSGNTILADIIFPANETLVRVPPPLRAMVTPEHTLDVAGWGTAEGGMEYCIPYAIRTSTKSLCPYLDDPAHATLRIYAPAPFYTTHRQTRDVPLCSALQPAGD